MECNEHLNASLMRLLHENIPGIRCLPPEEELLAQIAMLEYQKGNSTAPNQMESLITGFISHTDHLMVRETLLSNITVPGGRKRPIPFTTGEETGLHSHSFNEFMYSVKGTIHMKIAGQPVDVPERSMILLNVNVLHTEFLFPDESTYVVMDFDDRFFSLRKEDHPGTKSLYLQQLLSQNRQSCNYILFSPNTDSPTLPFFIELLMNELCQGSAGKGKIVEGVAERITELIPLEYHMSIQSSAVDGFHDALLSDIRQFILDNYSTITPSDIGKAFHYSPDYINRIFRRREHTTCTQLIQDARLSEAMRLLLNSSLPVEAVARYVGYSNQGFFYKKFFEKYNKTPGEVRRFS